MAALVTGEVVPMFVEQVGEDLGFDGIGGLGGVSVGIALLPRVGVWNDGWAVRVDFGGEDDAFAVRGPDGVVGFRELQVCTRYISWEIFYIAWEIFYIAQRFSYIAWRTSNTLEICDKNLLRAVAVRQKEDVFAVLREAGAVVAGLGAFDDFRFAARNFLNIDSVDFCVLSEVDVGDGVEEPFAVGGDVGCAEAAHLHHVLEGHGALCLGIRGGWEGKQ